MNKEIKKQEKFVETGEKIKEIEINREIFVKKQIILYAVLLVALACVMISLMLIFNRTFMIVIGVLVISIFSGLCMFSVYRYTKKISYTLYTNCIIAQFDTAQEQIPLKDLIDVKIYSSFLSKFLNYNTKRIVLYINDKSCTKRTLYSITEDAQKLADLIKDTASNLRKNI